MHNNALAAGALPQTPLGSSQRSPRPPNCNWGSAPNPAEGPNGGPQTPAGIPPNQSNFPAKALGSG